MITIKIHYMFYKYKINFIMMCHIICFLKHIKYMYLIFKSVIYNYLLNTCYKTL